MGVNSSTKTKFVGTGLTLKSLQALGVGKRVDVDGNALAYKFLGTGNKHLAEILSDMALHLKQLAYSGGFIVTVIFDGDKRPDCKRASLQRKKGRFLNEVNRMNCRFMGLKLKAQFEKDGNIELKRQLEEYSQECEKLEKVCQRSLIIPSDIASLFSDRLMMVEACSPNENGGYVDESVLTATVQADSLIATRSVSNLSDFIYGNDSDYFVLLGSKCLLMWNMKSVPGKTKKRRGRKRKNDSQDENVTSDATQYQVELYGACNIKIKELDAKLKENSLNLPSDLQWKEAEMPLFSFSDPTLRALIAISLGCDIFDDGIKDFGPKTIKCKIDKIVSENKPVVPTFRAAMKEKMKTLDDNVLNTLVSSLLFEPGLVDITKKVNTSYHDNNVPQIKNYAHEPPENYIFPTFIRSFSLQQHGQQNQEDQEDDPPLCHCDGFDNNGRHSHLKFEGNHTCSCCKKVFCKTCVFLPTKDIPKPTRARPKGRIYYREGYNDVLCLDCFKATRFVEAEVSASETSTNANVSIDTMRRVLNDKVGLQLNISGATTVEIMEMYDMYVASPLNTHDAIHIAEANKKIRYPLLPSDCIEKGNIFEPVGDKFELSNGGSFISNTNTVNDSNIPRVLELLTSLLKYDEDLVPTNEEGDGNIYIGKYDFLPSMFLNLAFYSRVDSGYRLLERCARHTCDPKSGSIYFQDAAFFEYCNKNEQKGKHLSHYMFSLTTCSLSLHVLSHYMYIISFTI